MKGIIDSTLREGEQAVGVLFSRERKMKIIRLLDSVGIEEIEIGICSPFNKELPALIRKIRSAGFSSRIALWCKCNHDDIDFAATLDPDVLSLSIPVSDLHIEKKLGKSRKWILETIQKSICRARKSGISRVSIGLEDATRADCFFLEDVVRMAEKAGAERIRIADTVGIANPAEIAGLVERLRRITSVEIGVHLHNDFGMATANSVATIEAGADWADTTVLGLGERAGGARTEEVAAYLALRRNRNYNTRMLPALAGVVANASGRSIAEGQPVVGPGIFFCESGLHLQGIYADPETYEPFSPEKVGAERKLLLGAKTGCAAVRHKLAEAGRSVSRKRLAKAVMHLRALSGTLGRPLEENEVSVLLSQLAR